MSTPIPTQGNGPPIPTQGNGPAGRLSLKMSQYSSKQQLYSPKKSLTGSLLGVP